MITAKRRKHEMIYSYEEMEKRDIVVYFTEALEEFFKEKKAENLSKNTLSTYDIHITNFLRYFGFYKPKCDLSMDSFIVKEMYIDWINFLREDEEKKDVTIATYCRSVKAFLYWCMDKEYCVYTKLKIPRYDAQIKETYKEDELRKILAKPSPDTTKGQFETWVFINIVAGTGLRLSSVLELKVSDFNSKENTLYIRKTKKRKAMVRHISKELSNIICKLIKKMNLDDTDYIFDNGMGDHLAVRTIQQNVGRYHEKVGVYNKKSIHLYRHTFAKNYIENKGDIRDLQQLLQHASIETTMNYLRELGVSAEASTGVYNPQQQYGKMPKRVNNKRRKM